MSFRYIIDQKLQLHGHMRERFEAFIAHKLCIETWGSSLYSHLGLQNSIIQNFSQIELAISLQNSKPYHEISDCKNVTFE